MTGGMQGTGFSAGDQHPDLLRTEDKESLSEEGRKESLTARGSGV